MFSYWTVIIIIGVHFLFDWGFQPRKWADKKHEEPRALFAHILIVAVSIVGIGWAMNLGNDLAPFIMINLILHALTDAISSNIFKNLMDAERKQLAIAVVAIDQFIHLGVLFGSLGMLLEK